MNHIQDKSEFKRDQISGNFLEIAILYKNQNAPISNLGEW